MTKEHCTKRPEPTSSLTDKQRLFVQDYLIDLNATQAAIRAGYSARTAYQQGSRLLTNVEVAAAISEGQSKRFDRLEMDAVEVLRELSMIGRANVFDYMVLDADGVPRVDFSKVEPAKRGAISEVTVEEFTEGRGEGKRNVRKLKFKLHDKLAALDKLAKHHGLVRDRANIENQNDEAVDAKNTAERRRAWIADMRERYRVLPAPETEKPAAVKGNGAVTY